MKSSMYPRCSQHRQLRARIRDAAALANDAETAYRTGDFFTAAGLHEAAERTYGEVMSQIAHGSEHQANRVENAFTEMEAGLQMLPFWQCIAELSHARQELAAVRQHSRELRAECEQVRNQSASRRQAAMDRVRRLEALRPHS